ncbi:Cysteine--tRNA ligase [Candidatus Xenohaliotis californiensis]|uniref:Cysteine--tRNA ligase n=1 Tax=Candidatus Xenohaliotis californiensis TaxID=84677 RepID=A0ABP0ETL6_9RICK|nr:Cysteine--tRNA ligase [Candidatus Xenohaliotis californiensis]
MFYIYNTKTHSKELLKPANDNEISMYVCGPTVYNYIHIGNARSLVCFDAIYRLLKYLYKKVIYVRNITNVDDKILKRSLSSNMPPSQIADIFTAAFHRDVKSLHCLEPAHEPKVSDHMDDIILMIQKLLDNKHAYISNKHVYFDITTYNDYGSLSGKKIKDLIAGSRVEVSSDKKNAGDFVLWKPTKSFENLSWNSPWGFGRPGWHIECSAMSMHFLGGSFDIHGGGVDLLFPHHENEMAQTICSSKNSSSAHYWMHNGFVSFLGDKMSKSIGNVITVKDLLDDKIDGEVIRYALLSTQYRKRLDWTNGLLSMAENELNRLYGALNGLSINHKVKPDNNFIECLCDDLNTPKAFGILHALTVKINKSQESEKQLLQNILYQNGKLLGLFNKNYNEWFYVSHDEKIEELIAKRNEAKNNKNYSLSDQIRNELEQMGIKILDHADGTSTWRKTGKVNKTLN